MKTKKKQPVQRNAYYEELWRDRIHMIIVESICLVFTLMLLYFIGTRAIEAMVSGQMTAYYILSAALIYWAFHQMSTIVRFAREARNFRLQSEGKPTDEES